MLTMVYEAVFGFVSYWLLINYLSVLFVDVMLTHLTV